MASVQFYFIKQSLCISGALIGLVALGAPFLFAEAQVNEIAVESATATDMSASSPARSFDPTDFGISVETLPNASDVIGDFVVGPGKFETALQPGESVTTEILISNRTGIDRRFNIEIEDAAGSVDGSDSIVLLGDDRGPYSIKDYIDAPTLSFDLRHGKRARVPVTITVPPDAEPGGLYGSVLINTVSVPIEQEIQAGQAAVRSPIVQRIGVLMFVTVPGDSIYEGGLKDFRIIPEKKWFNDGPFNFLITYENTGLSHLNPYGEIRITNTLGEEVGFVELQPWFALPQSVRIREVTWNRSMLYGKYTATISLNRGYEDIVDELAYSFWVIPWKPVAGGFALVFVLLFLLRSFFKKFEFKRKDS